MGMPLLLAPYVGIDPIQIAGPETDNAVAALPLDNFVTELLVRVVCRGPFELAHELADEKRWGDAHGEMDVGFGPTDLVDVHSRRVDASAADILMDGGLDFRNQKWGALLGVPDDMQVDFRLIVSGHGQSSKWLKPQPREAP